MRFYPRPAASSAVELSSFGVRDESPGAEEARGAGLPRVRRVLYTRRVVFTSMQEKVLASVAIILAVYLVLVALGRWLKHRLGIRFDLTFQVFALVLGVYVAAEGLNLGLPHQEDLLTVLIVLGVPVVFAVIRRFLFERHLGELRKILVPNVMIQATGLLLLVAVVLALLQFRYGVEIPGLLTGSGIAAVVLGLAMQDVLGNLLAGFSIHFSQPFKIGDWLILESRHAQVKEINWRSTRLRTVDDVCIDVPNSHIVKQTVVNLSYPSPLHAMRLTINVEYGAPPNQVKAALLHATVNARGVLAEPAATVFLHHFGDSAIEYEIKFWLEDHARWNQITDAIRTNAWYELSRRQMRIPFPIRTVQLERRSAAEPARERAAARAMLRQQPLFECLSEAHLDAILAGAKFLRFGAREKLIEQGQPGDSMFVIVRGRARVNVNRNNETAEVANLVGGDCFGEMSLLTGERRSATVVADVDCEVVEIGKAVLAGVLHQDPDLLARLSELLARRRVETEGILAATGSHTAVLDRQKEYTASFLAKLKGCFEL